MVKKKILVVDDEPGFLGVIRSRLEEEGHTVVVAADGEEALRKLKSEKPDVVLLDILMPRMDGLKVLRRIRHADRQLPVYMMTSFSTTERFGTAKKLGAAGFIVKTNDLKREIRNITSSIHLAAKYRPSRRGFTLVELMVSMVLLVGSVSAATFVFGRGIYATTDTELLGQGTALAQERMENLRGTAFASIASEAKAAVSGWTGFSRQVAVSQPAGTNTDFKQVVVTTYWDTPAGEVSTSLTSYVANVINN
jgi:prepilin-type N-terminal cleavage/methylation domain-containing protein